MKNLILFFMFAILLSPPPDKLNAQIYQNWSQRYNGSANIRDEPYSILLDNSNRIVVTGFTYNYYNGNDMD